MAPVSRMAHGGFFMEAYIVDVDGTVADLTHRLHHHPHNMAAFEAGVPDDLPIWPVIRLVRAVYDAGIAVVFTSGRSERVRGATIQWLKEHGVPFTAMYMRAPDDTRPDHVVKRQILDAIRSDGYEILGVIDDRQSVVDMWREEGLTCLQAAPSTWDMPREATPVLNLLVGPSGAGKSTFVGSDHAAHTYGIHPQHVIASDRVRLDLFGTLQCMDKNQAVFDAVRRVIRARIKSGLPCTVDATHIRDKDRIDTAELAGGICPVRYIVLDRPLPDKLRDGGWRLDVTFQDGSNLIQRHDQIFRSNIKRIMAGDSLPHVNVFDERVIEPGRLAAA
jgi:predicted kinase